MLRGARGPLEGVGGGRRSGLSELAGGAGGARANVPRDPSDDCGTRRLLGRARWSRWGIRGTCVEGLGGGSSAGSRGLSEDSGERLLGAPRDPPRRSRRAFAEWSRWRTWDPGEGRWRRSVAGLTGGSLEVSVTLPRTRRGSPQRAVAGPLRSPAMGFETASATSARGRVNAPRRPLRRARPTRFSDPHNDAAELFGHAREFRTHSSVCSPEGQTQFTRGR